MADILLKSKLYYFSDYANNEDVLEELSPKSDISLSLLSTCETYPNFKSNSMFFFARYDALVNSRIYVNDNSDNIKIVEDVGHDGLIMKCHKEQIDWCINHMKDFDDHNQI